MKRAFQPPSSPAEQPQGHTDVVAPSPYLTTEELVGYLRFPSLKAAYHWLSRNPSFPRIRRGQVLLFDRRIVDAYLRGELPSRRRTTLQRSA